MQNITDKTLFIVAEVDSAKNFQRKEEDKFEIGNAITLKQLKEWYANYLDNTFPNETNFPAIEGLDHCDNYDVLNQMEEELGIRFIDYKEYKNNTNNLKLEINEFIEFMEKNRDKNYKYFEKYYEKRGRLLTAEEPELLDFNPDSKALILSTLSFDDEGKTLRCIADISDNELFDDYLVIEGVTYNHKEIENFFNNKVERFNEEQNAVRKLGDALKYDLNKNAEILNATQHYLGNEYGAGEDVSLDELADEIIKNKGVIGLAYTELGNFNQFPVQVRYDLNNNQYKYELANWDVTDLIRPLEPDNITIDDFIRDMYVCDFEDLLHEHYDVLEKIYGDNWERKDFDSVDIETKINRLMNPQPKPPKPVRAQVTGKNRVENKTNNSTRSKKTQKNTEHKR